MNFQELLKKHNDDGGLRGKTISVSYMLKNDETVYDESYWFEDDDKTSICSSCQ